MTLKGKNILLCITGSIACYKSVDLYRRLKEAGAGVKIIVSSSAGRFISPYIFESFGEEVFTDDAFKSPLAHVSLSKHADLILIAPASFNTINKLAAGIADTLITLVVSASQDKPKVLVPAMNPNMYANGILRDNLNKLKEYNFHLASPETGNMACGDFGEGRFPDAEGIIFELESVFKEKTLKGKRVLVTAGATREYLDPVRFLSNASSGKMGISLANEAVKLGADVFLIALNIDAPCQYINKNMRIIKCKSFTDLKDTLPGEFKQCDILLMAAAVSDYSFKEKSSNKIKKGDLNLNVELVQNEDLLKALSGIKKEEQRIFGFAAETDSVIENGRKKLMEKSLDYIFINDVSKNVIGEDENEGFLINKEGKIKRFGRQLKTELAGKLLAEIIK
ncbi:MAG: bifunctional phosphopantothenoylcysteine decarboxylase/phosphopantothenate--cysteine ligase CoaBC [Deltaproteobacteria bacterium]|jgi:phosphopantothenoylcysteine decarboxylase/phosphopantothenate--cysteine ligase|nr:bifunctional phosphopantothenoylcysteine decarboxylase/phosphopantothenate--cysteine ligase CoaBC [Deltaproteobacteria bacterium]MCL5879881.1 bifunctional phosphopantothenoylcysteine decarboxylase/phosphopantothenate--cysteine ligase CoaBC [Deltaproteobacteria bacterium]MDA8304924.1 bifunctional phosphopantothenoylcysteine decarboxylase/phosphopantothenate--cysteine ligase CoaBC [Deltaproteobacteria bacterium]